jgi:hypothetical protein
VSLPCLIVMFQMSFQYCCHVMLNIGKRFQTVNLPQCKKVEWLIGWLVGRLFWRRNWYDTLIPDMDICMKLTIGYGIHTFFRLCLFVFLQSSSKLAIISYHFSNFFLHLTWSCWMTLSFVCFSIFTFTCSTRIITYQFSRCKLLHENISQVVC